MRPVAAAAAAVWVAAVRALVPVAWRTAALAGLWIVLSGGGHLAYGAGVVGAGVALSCATAPPWRRAAADPDRSRRRGIGAAADRVAGAVHLAGWFLWASLVGGCDVAARAVRRPVGIDPRVIEMPVVLPAGPARELAALMISLFPGALAVTVDLDRVRMHVLSPELAAQDQWETLQRLMARAAGLGATSGDADRPEA